jgi:hypothetical protein
MVPRPARVPRPDISRIAAAPNAPGEYRVPSTAEMAEFAEHFGKRRIELGTCVRPYNTPCIHEHARDNQWLGDITQLEQTLTHIDTKRDQLVQTLTQPATPLITPAPVS